MPKRPSEFGLPGINVAGFSRVGDTTQLPIDRHTTTYQLHDDFSLIHGSHVMKIGFEERRLQLNGIVDVLPRGSLIFPGALSGTGLSDLLLGLPTLAIQAVADNTQTLRTSATNVYFQDDWKVRPNLTLNLGARYEYNSPPTDPTNRMSTFDIATGQLNQVGTNGTSRSGLRSDKNNFAPRVGFAWTPMQKLVVRGGYGIYYDAGTVEVNSALYYNPPYFTIRVYFPSEQGLLTLQNPFPSSNGFTPPASLNVLSPDIIDGYLQHWNMNVQREFSSIGTLSLAYAGSKGSHLIHSRDLNQPAPGPGDISSRAPYPQYSNIFFVESGGNSTYHSFQASFNRSLARSLSVWAVYTFSKSIDDTSAFLPTKSDRNFPQNSHNYHLEKGLSSFDTPHRAAISWIYRVPGRNWWNRNFETSAIMVAQSGQPFTPTLRFDNSNTGNTGGNFGSDRPNLLHNPSISNPGPLAWFDTSAFAIPAQYTFGSAGRNILRGPGVFTLDLALGRRFALTERAALKFEVEAFNILNRANFNLPEAFADEPTTFGRIFSAKAPRQIQLALRLSF